MSLRHGDLQAGVSKTGKRENNKRNAMREFEEPFFDAYLALANVGACPPAWEPQYQQIFESWLAAGRPSPRDFILFAARLAHAIPPYSTAIH